MEDNIIFNPEAIPVFWEWFEQHALYLENWEALDSSRQDTLVDGISEQVHTYCKHVHPIIALEAGLCELIITANGFYEYFDVVEKLIQFAPQLEGWNFIALRPKTTDLFLYTGSLKIAVDPQALQFAPIVEEQDLLGLRFFIPDYKHKHKDAYLSIVITMMINLLGERVYGCNIFCVEVTHLPHTKMPEGLIPFLDLPDFLADCY